MKSKVTPEFRARLRKLPAAVQRVAAKNYKLWIENEQHPLIHFKPFKRNLWSARVGAHHRACGVWVGAETFQWTWIGSHEDYNKL